MASKRDDTSKRSTVVIVFDVGEKLNLHYLGKQIGRRRK